MPELNRDQSKGVGGTDAHDHIPQGPVAVVLAGAGARGAYEAGFIATLLPHLRPRPTIFVGTSAGAINAALLASVADRSPEAGRDEIIRRWGRINRNMVLGPIWQSVPLGLLRYVGSLVLGTESPSSFLSTEPLAKSLGDPALIDWHAINDNISNGHVDVLAFAATEAGSGRTKVFFQRDPKIATPTEARSAANAAPHATRAPFVTPDDNQAIDYVSTELTSEHVRASAAIPVLFPPVAIESAFHVSFFLDGGVRLNAPLKPALQFGANGIVVISSDPRNFGTSDSVEGAKPPCIQDQVLQIMRATFADRMIEDIRVLLDRNRTAREARRTDGQSLGGTAGGDRVVPVIFGGPLDQDRVGSVAARALNEILRGPLPLQVLKNPDLAVLAWLTSVSSTSGPDILSYLLFEPEFISAALRAGIQDAEALLNDYPDPASLWRSLHDREYRRRASSNSGTRQVGMAAIQAPAA